MKVNIYPPAHSMDTSFYALCEGALVEFHTGEPGIVPYNYPTIEDIGDNLVEVVKDCQNYPQIKQKIKDLSREYKEKDKDIVIRWGLSHILEDFMYMYMYNCKEQDEIALLEGEIDEFDNIYRYDLSNQPVSSPPTKLIKSIQSKLPSLPEICPEPTIQFDFSQAESRWNSEEPDIDLIEQALVKIVPKGNARDKFFRLTQAQTTKNGNPSAALVNWQKIHCHQISVILLSHPFSIPTLKKETMLFCLAPPSPYSSRYTAEHDVEMVKHLKKLNPQAVLYLYGTFSASIVDLLRKIYQHNLHL